MGALMRAPDWSKTPLEPLELLAKGPRVDVITDRQMPGMNGAALAHEVKARWP